MRDRQDNEGDDHEEQKNEKNERETKERDWAGTAYQLSTVVNGANRLPYTYGIGHVSGYVCLD